MQTKLYVERFIYTKKLNMHMKLFSGITSLKYSLNQHSTSTLRPYFVIASNKGLDESEVLAYVTISKF